MEHRLPMAEKSPPERHISRKGMIMRGVLGLPTPQIGGRWGAKHFYFLLFIFLIYVSRAFGTVPRFFEANRMANLLLPQDTEVDSIIYRLRAEDSDRDYPLSFRVKGKLEIIFNNYRIRMIN